MCVQRDTGDEMKKIGLIGGLSWVSTAEYYRRLNEITQQHLGGVASARIAMESVNRQAYVEAVIDRGDEAAACDQILDAVRGVERAGADFVVISCNDVHRFVPEIAPQVGHSISPHRRADGGRDRAPELEERGFAGCSQDDGRMLLP